jgi:hypothetical protein
MDRIHAHLDAAGANPLANQRQPTSVRLVGGPHRMVDGGSDQSPSVGLGTNWATVPSSAATDAISIPMNNINGNVFYRLAYA